MISSGTTAGASASIHRNPPDVDLLMLGSMRAKSYQLTAVFTISALFLLPNAMQLHKAICALVARA